MARVSARPDVSTSTELLLDHVVAQSIMPIRALPRDEPAGNAGKVIERTLRGQLVGQE